MLGLIYLLTAGMVGYKICKNLLLDKKSGTGANNLWIMLPASFGTGVLLLTWAVYVTAWLVSVYGGKSNPLFYGNLIVLVGTVAVLAVGRYRRLRRREELFQEKFITDKSRFLKEAVFFSVLLIFVTYMMFYVFFIRGGVLYSGFTVYGDYAPHTAMMRSFSLGNNFPTQYPHFGGEDVKYHFMFQFLTGNLEYLGMRMDLAYNLVSIASLLGFLMLLYQLALRITRKMCCGVLACIFFFFRSGAAFFRFAWEHLQAGDLLQTLGENTSFIGYTANEDWGLWNFNVYLNQRHLAFGMLMVALALWIYMDWLEAGNTHEETGWKWMQGRFFSKDAWRSRNITTALLMGMLLGLCTFWNGAAVIGGLLILLGFAAFSDGKADYAVTAGTAVFFSLIQSKIFISGNAMSPSLYLGFLAEEKTIPGIIKYLFWMGGIFFLGLVVIAVFLKRKERTIIVSFLFPGIFAFMFSLTPDINVNHKYVMISYAFLTIFWAWAVCAIWEKRKGAKIAAVLLAVCITVTGIYDFAVIVKGNGQGRRVAVNMDSRTTTWLAANLEKDDLVLTPEYSMNEVTMAGVMMYCGWPYYAWSAGYDTNYRAARAVEIYTAADSESLRQVVKQEKITYILFEENMEFEQRKCREDIIAETYEKVFESEDGRIRIYETR